MRNIDLLKEARALAPRCETDFRLHTVNVIYTPDPLELPPGTDPPGLDPGQALTWLKLFGKDTSAFITTEPILIRWKKKAGQILRIGNFKLNCGFRQEARYETN